jgi:hypothetical protein
MLIKETCSMMSELVQEVFPLGDPWRPLKNTPFCPISASGSNLNPRKTKSIPVVKIFAFLDLEHN